ncbi:NAD(P)-binding domain-containing protein [Sporolactobacillus shoreicorticis]|uniref:NAD(P)-binding domain-containing protein n=1 Tax=Sporolactobacillus shoreicorticis TaxID=1923877 RepID=A0ABW5S305_9BACL|nr:NAD(P)-binding domain-containing protein [Sporolactobacillus shoreicorticis]MCO7127865.1 NAD(P)-binding domain-containing protein [Sporolactobacillus shoreicorticis]
MQNIVIVGAGAAGIGLGVLLQKAGIKHFSILEKDKIGSSFRQWPKEMRMDTPSFPRQGFGALDLNALSLFSAAHHVWLFLPYIVLLMLGGVLHTRIWHKHKAAALSEAPFIRRSFLQTPTWRDPLFRLRSVIRQFLLHAMPIFRIICLLASFLDIFNLIHYVAHLFYPLLALLNLPTEAGIGIAFSMIRKDGMLIFNEGSGTLLAQLSIGQLFLLVFLASTVSACAVTIWTVGRELGIKEAAKLISRQLITSIICSTALFLALFQLPRLF